jgi:ubiquinone/menaquinone biosynthesis C-methylase UbiE
METEAMPDLDALQRLYATTALLYETNIIPTFGPLAYDLATWVARCYLEQATGGLRDPFAVDLLGETFVHIHDRVRVLDVGTGTGILGRALGNNSVISFRVIGLDLSMDMLKIGAARCADLGLNGIRFLHADVHRMPLRRGSIDLAVSSFGLNHTEPKRALRALAAVLRSDRGILAFQEWGAEDPCTQIVNETLKQYAPDDVPGLDDAMRECIAAPKPWYEQLQDEDDFREMLAVVGFRQVWAREAPFVAIHFGACRRFWTAS